MARATLTFPSDFLWGTATSAYQVEGQNENSDWWDWEARPGQILEGHRSGPACDWWHNAERDLDIAAELGTNAHRLSLEWSRIEPEPSVFDPNALARYREILQYCHKAGIDPMVTLHHFSNPRWLVEKGDFNSDIVVDYFRRYVEKVVEALGDLVSKWITINEPMTYGVLRYLTNEFPAPTRTGLGPLLEATHNLLRCHAAAYHAIKEIRPDAQVGVAHNMQIFEARPEGGFLDPWWARQVTRLYNEAWPDAVHTGQFRGLFGRKTIKHLAGTYDFFGLNYYTRFYVHFPPQQGFVDRAWLPDALISDGKYGEVYPAGLYQLIKYAWKRYKKPIYITENGLPDQADHLRPGFILSHLKQIWHAISFCYPIMGYYHWSLVDNFEWDRGWTQRFGLIEMDPATQTRTWRPSARLYQEICRSHTITDRMAERYAPELLSTMFPGQSPDEFLSQRR